MKRLGIQTVLVVLLLVGMAGGVRAFSVSSGFSEPCHEHITSLAYGDFILEMSTPWIVIPEDGSWRRLSDYFVEQMGMDPDRVDDGLKFILVSLIMGVRAPDTDGHAMANIESLRRIHGDPRTEGQHAHSLRAPEEDYDEGNAQAVDGAREMIMELVAEGQAYLFTSAAEQVIKVEGYLDFYGRFDIEVWAPMYYVGQAAHALQDTFSHTLRSDADNLYKIVHVANYVEAIGTHFDERRDGLAHSIAMDDCFRSDMAELTDAAIEASIDFFIAVRQQYNGWDPHAIEHVLDKWVTLKPGCSFEDHFCGNERWEKMARTDPTGPYVEGLFGCAHTGAGLRSALGLICVYLGFFVWLRRFRNPGRRA